MEKELEEKIKEVQNYQSTIKEWRNKFNSKEYILASELNRYFFGIPLNKKIGCQCVEDFFVLLKIELKNKSIKKIMEKVTKKFVPKGVLMSHSIRGGILGPNSTDEDCMHFISLNPELHSKKFEKMPSDWEDLVKDFTTKEAKEKEAKAKATKKVTKKVVKKAVAKVSKKEDSKEDSK